MKRNNDITNIKVSERINSKEENKIEYLNDLENINVSLIDHTPWPFIVQQLPNYVNLETSGDSNLDYSSCHIADNLEKSFKSTALPSILETIHLTFRIEGISVQDVLSLIRNQTFSFSAKSTVDSLYPDFKVIVPESIENSPEFFERYKDLTNLCRELFTDMIDSKKISPLDACLILNKNHNNFYHASCNFKDLLIFVKQQINRNNQSKSFALLTYQMWLAVCQQYPIAHLNLVDFNQSSDYYNEDLSGTNSLDGKTKFESILTEYKGDLVFFSETAAEHIEMIRKGDILTVQSSKHTEEQSE